MSSYIIRTNAKTPNFFPFRLNRSPEMLPYI